jgi:predicted esterase
MIDRFSKSAVLLLAVLLLFSVPAFLFADIVILNTGGKVEGRIIERTLDGVKVKTVKGIVDIPEDDIESIKECESVFDIYEKKLKETPEDDVEARFKLGLWCKEKELEDEAEKHFEEVIKLSPDHEEARAELGYVKTAKGWEILPPPKEEPTSTAKKAQQPDLALAKKAAEAAQKKKEPEKKEKKKKPGKTFPKRDPGITKDSFTYKGKEQSLVLEIPRKYTGEEPLPFVILLHGAGDKADNFLRAVMTRLKHDDLIAVAPENATMPKDAVVELIKKYLKELNIDKKRIYMFGFSMGGWHTSTVAPRLPKVFAAFVIAGAGNKAGVPKANKGYPSAGILIGKSDPNYKHSVRAYEAYKRAGWDTKFWDFDGGHVLPGSELMNEVFDWMLSKKKGKK